MSLQAIIEQAFEDRGNISPNTASDEVRAAVNDVLVQLDNGSLRVLPKKSTVNGSYINGLKKRYYCHFA